MPAVRRHERGALGVVSEVQPGLASRLKEGEAPESSSGASTLCTTRHQGFYLPEPSIPNPAWSNASTSRLCAAFTSSTFAVPNPALAATCM